ncbi:hypothetical protein [Stutzerimonas nitrititolerans]|uniref:hypothetical protein n=1 Tax=Stutzerimonas nitrititolerans TaxID=2482751 RepID=UPI0028AA6C78|nr:hypothetical protein [Stutzerimonas nitrititolerans]
MKITSLKGSMGRDLYGTMECEHCGTSDKLFGGYDDGHWHNNVLPAFHCKACGKNRSGELHSAEVTARNQANGVNGI